MNFPNVSGAFLKAKEAELFAKARIKAPILDLGCGDGRFMRMALGRPVDVGIDLNYQTLIRGREARHYGAGIVADITRLPFADAAFNTVVSNSVLEHVEGVAKGFQEIARVLRPGGRLMFTLHTTKMNRLHFAPRWRECFGLDPADSAILAAFHREYVHHNTWPVEGWLELIRQVGLESDSWCFYLSPACTAFHTLFLDVMRRKLLGDKETGYVAGVAWARLPEPVRALLMRASLPIGRAYARSLRPSEDGGYVFITAVRP